MPATLVPRVVHSRRRLHQSGPGSAQLAIAVMTSAAPSSEGHFFAPLQAPHVAQVALDFLPIMSGWSMALFLKGIGVKGGGLEPFLLVICSATVRFQCKPTLVTSTRWPFRSPLV